VKALWYLQGFALSKVNLYTTLLKGKGPYLRDSRKRLTERIFVEKVSAVERAYETHLHPYSIPLAALWILIQFQKALKKQPGENHGKSRRNAYVMEVPVSKYRLAKAEKNSFPRPKRGGCIKLR